MQLKVSLEDGAPIYLQIVEQVKYLIAGGRLKPGETVPPIRILAAQLRVNPNTVARAYLELERAGLLVMRQGLGTTVAEGHSPLPRREKLKILARGADALLADARHLGVPLDDLLDLMRQRDHVLEPEPESK